MNTAQQLAVQKMLSAVDTYRASALHLSVGNPPMMRVGGKLVPIPDQPILVPKFMEDVIVSWLDERQKELLEVNKDITFAHTFENKKRFKISAFYQQGHLSASLILVPDVIPSIAQLGLPDIAQRMASAESGLILVIGPFGSKRALTIASFIEYLNQTTQKHIITVEQPIEFLFADNQCVIEQREVGTDVHTVANGLEFALDEDVDVVMVSDLSTVEAIQKVLEVADAGKLVFAMMNANSIVSAFNLMIHNFEGLDIDQVRGQLANSLVGVINQRIIPSITGDKTMVAEVMIPNDAIRTIIKKGDLYQINNILLNSREQGMRPLDVALKEAVAKGEVSTKDAVKYATNPRLFQQ